MALTIFQLPLLSLCLCVFGRYAASDSDVCIYAVPQCVRSLEPTFDLITINDFVSIASSLDTVCIENLPRAEDCLNAVGCGDPPVVSVSYIRKLCANKHGLQAGIGCWRAGFQSKMFTCQRNMPSSIEDYCFAVENLKSCMLQWVHGNPHCTAAEGHVLENLFRVDSPECK